MAGGLALAATSVACYSALGRSTYFFLALDVLLLTVVEGCLQVLDCRSEPGALVQGVDEDQFLGDGVLNGTLNALDVTHDGRFKGYNSLLLHREGYSEDHGHCYTEVRSANGMEDILALRKREAKQEKQDGAATSMEEDMLALRKKEAS